MFENIKFEELYLEPTRNGLTRPSKVRGIGIKMINMGELFAYSRINNPPMELVQVTDKEFQNFSIKSGDLLFARQSLIASGAGQCSLVIDAPEPTVFESHLIRLRLDNTKADSVYYYYFFSSEIGNGMVQGMVMEVAASGIRGSDLAKLKVLYPPLLTQQRIAFILSAYDDLIEVNNQRIKLLEETARELYKEWFVRMRFPDYKKAKFKKGIPEGWQVKRLGEVLEFRTGKLNSNAAKEDGKYPFFTCSNTNYKTDTFSFDTEAVLLAGNNAAGIYPLKYFNGKFDAYQRTYIIKPKDDKLSHKYVYHYFLENLDFLQAISIGAATQFLTTQMLKKLLILQPDKNSMSRFSEIADPIFEQLQTLQQQNTQLRQIRDRLLPRLISGKLQVKEKVAW